MSQIIAATVFVDLEGDYLDIRYFIACLKLPLIFFFFSNFMQQSLIPNTDIRV